MQDSKSDQTAQPTNADPNRVIQQPPIVDPEGPETSDPTYKSSAKPVPSGILLYGGVLVLALIVVILILTVF